MWEIHAVGSMMQTICRQGGLDYTMQQAACMHSCAPVRKEVIGHPERFWAAQGSWLPTLNELWQMKSTATVSKSCQARPKLYIFTI